MHIVVKSGLIYIKPRPKNDHRPILHVVKYIQPVEIICFCGICLSVYHILYICFLYLYFMRMLLLTLVNCEVILKKCVFAHIFVESGQIYIKPIPKSSSAHCTHIIKSFHKRKRIICRYLIVSENCFAYSAFFPSSLAYSSTQCIQFLLP